MRAPFSLLTSSTATLLMMPVAAIAADASAAPVGAGSVLQVLLGLALVLAMVFVAAWAMRRFSPNAASGSSALRVVATTAVGNRERVMLIEVNDAWLVIGVAPGRVCAIHSMARPDSIAHAQPAPAPGSFAVWLKRTLDRRNHD